MGDLLHRLANLHQLHRPGLGVDFQLVPLCPLIGFNAVIDVAKQQAVARLVNDDAKVAADPHRPEILAPGVAELMKTHSRVGQIQLQIKGRGFHGLLLVAGQFGEAVGEGVGDAEVHISMTPIEVRRNPGQTREHGYELLI